MQKTVFLDDEDLELCEPPQPRPVLPSCNVCPRNAYHKVSVLLYPKTPTLSVPTYGYGARVFVGFVCKDHKRNWTSDSFLKSAGWLESTNRQRFLTEFGSEPDPSLAQLQVIIC